MRVRVRARVRVSVRDRVRVGIRVLWLNLYEPQRWRNGQRA